MDLSPGLMVSPNVRLTRPLGEGAMGCVWVADHLTLRTQVAVKFISAELAADNQEIVARFVQEATLAAQIKSPHVVQIFDQGVMNDGTPYMVMELLEGESLQSWLDRRGRLSVHEAATVVIHVSRALRRAHELGIVHRDIKPDNIFVAQNEDGLFCKVLDFGIAKQTQLPKMGLTNAGVMVGTPEYMSPEQVLSAKDVDFRADLWALAVTTYYMLTGQLPFTAEALGTLCVKLLDGKFRPPSELRGDVPAGTDAWCLRALAQDPDDRFESARDMAVAFVRLIAKEEGIEEEVSFTRVMPLPARPELGPRNKLAASGIDATAPLPLDLTAPLPAIAVAAPTAPLPAPAVEAAKTGTLTGSSSSRRAEAEPNRRPIAAFLGGGAAIGVLIAAIVLLATPGDEASPAAQPGPADPAAADEKTAAPDEEPSSDAQPEGAGSEGDGSEGAEDPEPEAAQPDATTPTEADSKEDDQNAEEPPLKPTAPRPLVKQPKPKATEPKPEDKPKHYDHGF